MADFAIEASFRYDVVRPDLVNDAVEEAGNSAASALDLGSEFDAEAGRQPS